MLLLLLCGESWCNAIWNNSGMGHCYGIGIAIGIAIQFVLVSQHSVVVQLLRSFRMNVLEDVPEDVLNVKVVLVGCD